MPPFPPSDALNYSSNKTNSNEANEPMGAGLSKRCWSRTARCAGAGAGLLLAAAVAAAGSAPVLAQNKELSDKSVQLLMQYAWALTPPKFTAPDGKTIEVDKTKPKDVIVSHRCGARGDHGGAPVGLCAARASSQRSSGPTIRR